MLTDIAAILLEKLGSLDKNAFAVKNKSQNKPRAQAD